jgi:hypothetical protein
VLPKPAICPYTNITVSTPFNAAKWLQLFIYYGFDRDYVCELVFGLLKGVNIDFTGNRNVNRFGANHTSAATYATAVTEDIKKAVSLRHRIGPYSTTPFPYHSISPIGVVTKKHSTKLRIIHDLSYKPRHRSKSNEFEHSSINECIVDPSVELAKFDDAVTMLMNIPIGTKVFLSKLDVSSAYKAVPVRPKDWCLLGLVWNEKYYYEISLPFGLGSSCKKWETYGTGIHLILNASCKLDGLVHYIDDFLTASLHSAANAQIQVSNIMNISKQLGIPWNLDKLEVGKQILFFWEFKLIPLNEQYH